MFSIILLCRIDEFKGQGTKVNEEKAIKFLKIAAQYYRVDASIDLADYYQNNGNQDEVKEWENYAHKIAMEEGKEEDLLTLAAYFRKNGRLNEAHSVEKLYKEKIFNLLSPLISQKGGTLLTIASNSPTRNQIFLKFNSKASAKLIAKREKIFNELLAENVFTSQDERISPYQEKVLNGGICAGMVLEFLSLLPHELNANSLEEQLLVSAHRFECRSGVSAIAFQVIMNDLGAKEWVKYPNAKKAAKEDYKKIIFKVDQPIVNILFKIRGQKVTQLPELEASGVLNDSDYLNKWLNSCQDGNYRVGIQATSSLEEGHALALIKKEGSVFLWDPNFGLIKCSRANPIETITQLLNLFYPIPSSPDNHSINILRIDPLMPLL